MNAQPAIDMQHVLFRYGKSATDPSLLIPKWQLQQGQQVFLHGESGSGKTTLLNLLAGVLTPQEGTISLLGSPFSTLSNRQRDKFRARHIGVVFQQFNLIPYLSVLRNIQLASYFAGADVDKIEDKARALLLRLKLPADLIHRPANKLSVGQQQRVALARALINQPELLLVDEPTSALDASARDAFMGILTELCRDRQTSMIFVSHDMYLERFFETSIHLPAICRSAEV